MLVYAYTMAGERETAMDILNIQLEKCKNQHVTAFMMSTINIGLGDKINALEWLELDREERGKGVLLRD